MSKKDKKPKVRRYWNIDPATKVEADETQEYDRASAKRDWLKELDEELTNTDEWEQLEDE